jgi:hypothetical protein
MGSYLYICNCGRIHLIDKDEIHKAIKNNKYILMVCENCCNKIAITGDVDTNPEDGYEAYIMYHTNFKKELKEITYGDLMSTSYKKGLYKVIFDEGYPVPMKTGNYATSYDDKNGFYDNILPDNDNSNKVDMEKFISITPDDALKYISSYLITGLDWKGDKYDTGNSMKEIYINSADNEPKDEETEIQKLCKVNKEFVVQRLYKPGEANANGVIYNIFNYRDIIESEEFKKCLNDGMIALMMDTVSDYKSGIHHRIGTVTKVCDDYIKFVLTEKNIEIVSDLTLRCDKLRAEMVYIGEILEDGINARIGEIQYFNLVKN